ncbi:MAG TPA: hypothetical protein VM616_09235 [Gammaproteobacteria bacterium]|nr:hypothetical protein [Gammaproteobacteria bacterium]
MSKKPAGGDRPKNPISRRDWVARAIEGARKAVAEHPPAPENAARPARPPRD